MEPCVQVRAVATHKKGLVEALQMGNWVVASARRKNATHGFAADPQATAMSWKDGRGGNVQGVVAAQQTRFSWLLTGVISGGTKLAITSTSSIAKQMAQVTCNGIDFVVIRRLSDAVDLNAALAGCRTAGPYEEEVHGVPVPCVLVHSSSTRLNVFSGKGRYLPLAGQNRLSGGRSGSGIVGADECRVVAQSSATTEIAGL
jgi:hypothetical protein